MPYLDIDHTANNSFINNYAECLLFVCFLSSFSSHYLFKFRSPGTAIYFPLKYNSKISFESLKKLNYTICILKLLLPLRGVLC